MKCVFIRYMTILKNIFYTFAMHLQIFIETTTYKCPLYSTAIHENSGVGFNAVFFGDIIDM